MRNGILQRYLDRGPIILLTLLLLSRTALPWLSAQGTVHDYERANELRERYQDQVFRSTIDPVWIAGAPLAWYRVELARGEFEFVLVNAEEGDRGLAFDHETMAAVLSDLFGSQFSASNLPLKSLEFDSLGNLLGFQCRNRRVERVAPGRSWRFGEERDEKPRSRRSRNNGGQASNRPKNESPDRQWKVEIRNHNVWLTAVGSGESEQLSFEGNEMDAYLDQVYWAPNSSRFVVVRRLAAQEHTVQMIESAPDDQLQPKLHSMNYLKPGDRVAVDKPQLFEVSSMSKIPVVDTLFKNPFHLLGYRWQEDSKAFSFVYNQRGHQVLRVIRVDGYTGNVRAIVDENSPTFIDYAYKQFRYFVEDSNELIWMSERDGWNHLYLFDQSSGRMKNQITQGEWVVREVDYVDVKRRQIWFQAGGIIPDQDPYFLHACRINFDGTGLTILTEGNGTHELHYSPDRSYLIATHSRVDMAPVTELRRGSDGERISILEKSDLGLLKRQGWRAPERFDAKGRDGTTDIFGVIYRPSNYHPDRSYPVIEHIYAGPHGSHVPKNFRAYRSSQAMAELGFIVVRIDGMGTSNRSKRFHDVCWQNLKDAGFPDRILWMKAAAEKDPSMDLSRVGIYGGSAGGQNTVSALLHFPDFYKVGVADCGCHDNRMDKIWWNELWMGWPIGTHYEENSNTTHAAKLEGNLFLTVGELDRNVDPASTLQLVDALIEAEKEFDFMMIPGGGHGVGDSVPFLIRKRQDFFVRHLYGREPRSGFNAAK